MGKIKGWTKHVDKYSREVWKNDSRNLELWLYLDTGNALKWSVFLINKDRGQTADLYGAKQGKRISISRGISNRDKAKQVAIKYMRRHPNG